VLEAAAAADGEPWLWAVGDVVGQGAYTHVSMHQAGVCVRDLLGQAGPLAETRAVPHVTFTDPEVAGVGLSEAAAREAGISVAVGRQDVGANSRGWIHQARGVVKLVADTERDVLVGATVVAPAGGEIIGLLSLAVHAEVPLPTLRSMVLAFPTMHRAVSEALADLDA
jgi:pyruvate/2-oxoglutarate dehydrogenase complex dihydrolipoamide dehydrogenase (E3) component